MSEVRRTAEAIYRGEGLALPDLEASQVAALRQLAEGAFSTRELAWSLYDFNRFVDELVTVPPAPYAAFGFSGHGFASQAVHFYSVDERMAFLVQLRWGAALGEPEADRKRYHALLATARTLQGLAEAAARAGRFPRAQRLVVAQSTFHGSRWGWTRTGAQPQWHWSRDLAMIDAAAELHRIGNTPIPA